MSAAHNGATPHQLMAIFGWRTLKEAERYTKDADQRRIASGAMRLLIPERTQNESGQPPSDKWLQPTNALRIVESSFEQSENVQ